jgi:hypothetical protein
MRRFLRLFGIGHINVWLLRQVQLRIRNHPGSFDMSVWGNHCGCIGSHALLIAEGVFTYDFAHDFAIHAQRVLRLTDQEAVRLFYMHFWPKSYSKNYGHTDVENACARIDHFIRTKGQE